MNEPVDQLRVGLDQLAGQSVLVLGDAMLDHYIWGETDRISPEAPVPVVKVQRESDRLGGAANVAHNIMALGGHPILVSVIGADEGGKQLREALEGRGISTEQLVVDPGRPTIKKTRVIARSQQVVRIDREEVHELGDAALEVISHRIGAALAQVQAVLISDYGKGVISERLLERWLPRLREAKLPICVDPKESHFHSYRRVTVLTPNLREAAFAGGRPITDQSSLEQVGRRLLDSLEAEYLLVTRGEEGMTLLRAEGPALHIPSVGRDVYDVTGAGDTVISTLTVALAAGLPIEDATRLANHAAGCVIRELGTATVSREGILESLRSSQQPDGICPGGACPEGVGAYKELIPAERCNDATE
ncbi:MAG: D-glycero-beta-D-manno-heptose-7-phosphate kinase [Candidatus Eisenbacteria sp.]|nr:D-glycero-beta-D-manno-heptose-7-phosphate kinase [Candidatus Eisenbacteria bacterium]